MISVAEFLILTGVIMIAVAIAARWVDNNSWQSDGFDSDPRLRL